VLSWRLSITMDAAFCIETLEDALARHGKPDIFSTDQGSQFTGAAFTGVLAGNGIARQEAFLDTAMLSITPTEDLGFAPNLARLAQRRVGQRPILQRHR